VIDLRYNSGGNIIVSNDLGNLIAGEKAIKGAFVRFVWNDKKQSSNQTLRFDTSRYSLDPARVFFLTSNTTSYASEVLINAVKPYLDVYIIGDDTDGKPVGQNGYEYDDYALVPVSFSMYNLFKRRWSSCGGVPI